MGHCDQDNRSKIASLWKIVLIKALRLFLHWEKYKMHSFYRQFWMSSEMALHITIYRNVFYVANNLINKFFKVSRKRLYASITTLSRSKTMRYKSRVKICKWLLPFKSLISEEELLQRWEFHIKKKMRWKWNTILFYFRFGLKMPNHCFWKFKYKPAYLWECLIISVVSTWVTCTGFKLILCIKLRINNKSNEFSII